MNLVVDIGNNYTKVAVFKNDEISKINKYKNCSKKIISQLIRSTPGIHQCIISSVKNNIGTLTNHIKKKMASCIVLDHDTPLPIKNQYKSKATLGYDRISNVVAANYIFPNNNILVIDAGTAITYDIVNHKNEFIGGNISPGLAMRFEALHKNTDKLPLLSWEDQYPDIGFDTTTAILSGVQQGIINETTSFIDKMEKQFNNLKIFFTGGDVFFFDKRLKNSIFVYPNLSLIGLNRILEYNVNN